MKLPSVVDLYSYEHTLINMVNSSKHLFIQPDDSIIAVNNDRCLYVSMTENELHRCTNLHNMMLSSNLVSLPMERKISTLIVERTTPKQRWKTGMSIFPYLGKTTSRNG